MKPQTRPGRANFSDLVQGMRVFVAGVECVVIDKTEVEYSAWENWPTDKRMVVEIASGRTYWLDSGDSVKWTRG